MSDGGETFKEIRGAICNPGPDGQSPSTPIPRWLVISVTPRHTPFVGGEELRRAARRDTA